MKNNIKKISILLLPLLCISCSKGFIRYGVKPYINIDKHEKGEIITLLPSQVQEKINEKNSFPLLIQRTTCDACTYAKENYINPFLEENNIYIYSINLTNFDNESEEYEIYTNISSNFNNKNSIGNRVIPFLAVFDQGNFINGEIDSKYYELLLKSYFIL